MFSYLYSFFAFAIADLFGISEDYIVDLAEIGMNLTNIPVASFVLLIFGLVALCLFLYFCFKVFWTFICKIFDL